MDDWPPRFTVWILVFQDWKMVTCSINGVTNQRWRNKPRVKVIIFHLYQATTLSGCQSFGWTSHFWNAWGCAAQRIGLGETTCFGLRAAHQRAANVGDLQRGFQWGWPTKKTWKCCCSRNEKKHQHLSPPKKTYPKTKNHNDMQFLNKKGQLFPQTVCCWGSQCNLTLVAFLGSQVVLSPVVSGCPLLCVGVGVGWCGSLPGLSSRFVSGCLRLSPFVCGSGRWLVW